MEYSEESSVITSLDLLYPNGFTFIVNPDQITRANYSMRELMTVLASVKLWKHSDEENEDILMKKFPNHDVCVISLEDEGYDRMYEVSITGPQIIACLLYEA